MGLQFIYHYGNKDEIQNFVSVSYLERLGISFLAYRPAGLSRLIGAKVGDGGQVDTDYQDA